MNTNKNVAIFLGAVLAFFLTAFILPAKKELKFNLKEGKVYKLQTVANQTLTQKVMNMEQTIKQVVESRLKYDVKENKDGIMKILVSYESFAYKMDMQPYISMNYDSKDKQDRDQNPFYDFLDAMIGKEFTVTMDAKGNVLEVEDLDKGIQEVINDTQLSDSSNKERYAQQLRELMGAENFKRSFEMITAIYPDKAVDEGETWTKKLDVETAMPINYSNTYTLKERNANRSVIGLDSQIKSNTMDQTDTENKYDISGTQKGEITVDTQSGWIEKSDMKNYLSGTMFVKNEQVPQGIEVPITIDSHIVSERYD